MVCSWCLVQRGHYWLCCYCFLVIIPNLNSKSSWSGLLQVSAKANPATSSAIVSLDLNLITQTHKQQHQHQHLFQSKSGSPASYKVKSWFEEKIQIQKSDKGAGSDNRGAKSGLHSARKGVIAMMMVMLMMVVMMTIRESDKDAESGLHIAHTRRE